MISEKQRVREERRGEKEDVTTCTPDVNNSRPPTLRHAPKHAPKYAHNLRDKLEDKSRPG